MSVNTCRLWRGEPNLARPFRAPAYPVFPAFALAAAVVCLGTMIYFNPLVALLFAGLGVVGYGYFPMTHKRREAALAAA